MILMGENPFRGPTLSNGQSNGFAPIKIIKSKRHIKKADTLVILCTWVCCRCILYSVFFSLYSVLYVVSFMWFSGPIPSKGPPPPPSPSGTKWIHFIPAGEGGGGEEGSPFPLPSLALCTEQVRNQQQYEIAWDTPPVHKKPRRGGVLRQINTCRQLPLLFNF